VSIKERMGAVQILEYKKNNILLFDGAMGTMLQQKGLKLGENPEIFGISKSRKTFRYSF
jgi:5-methyltetrahydrofolate--homocysteine methyltransferase